MRILIVKNLASSYDVQFFPFKSNWRIHDFLEKTSNFLSLPVNFSSEEFVKNISGFLKVLFSRDQLDSREFASFLLPWTNTIFGFNDLEKVQFISPFDVRVKIFEKKFLESRKKQTVKVIPKIEIKDKEFLIVGENNLPFELKIHGDTPVFLLNKRDPGEYGYGYIFGSITLDISSNLKDSITKIFKLAKNDENKLRFLKKNALIAFARKAFFSTSGFNKKAIKIENLNLYLYKYKNVFIYQDIGSVVCYDPDLKKDFEINVVSVEKEQELYQSLKDQFFQELSLGDIAAMDDILNKGLNVDVKDSNGRTALINACINDSSLDIIDFLLRNGANPNVLDNYGFTPIIILVSKGQLKKIKFLLQNGADLNFNGEMASIIFNLTVIKNDFDFIKYFIEYNPYIDAKIGGYLRNAKKIENRSEIINYLEVIYRIMIFSFKGDLKNIKSIVTSRENNFDAFYWGIALHNAVVNNHISVLKYLLSKGVNVNYIDTKGRTALFKACDNNSPNLEIIKILLDNGAAPNIYDNFGDTPIIKLVARSNLQALKLLLKKGANPNVLSGIGWHPLHYAIVNSNLSIIKQLIENGADLNIKTKNNESLVEIARRSNSDKEIINYLDSAMKKQNIKK